MQKEDGNKNQLRSNTRNQRQQIQPRRDIKNRGVRDKIHCKDAIEDGAHYFFLQTTRLSSTPLSRRSVSEGGSTLSFQPSTLNFSDTVRRSPFLGCLLFIVKLNRDFHRAGDVQRSDARIYL